MHQIFLSYASEDKQRARVFAHALDSRGFSVWWDHEIPVGASWADVIEENIKGASCVVVLWSRHSADSRWVKKEARHALGRNVLIPVLIDGTEIPFEFEDVEAAHLQDWGGGPHDEFDNLLARVASLVGTPPKRGAPPPVARSSPTSRWPAFVAGGTLVAAVAIVGTMAASGSFGDRPANGRQPGDTGRTQPTQFERPPEPRAVNPTIVTFSASPAQIERGSAATLTWEVRDASSVVIDSREFQPTGSTTVRPDSTTTYSLVARSSGGQETRDTTRLLVTEPVPQPDAELAKLVADLNDEDRITRMQATDLIKNNHSDDPVAVGAVLEWLSPSRIDQVSIQGMVNVLFYLKSTSISGWTQDHLDAGRAAVRLLNDRRRAGMLGDQAAAELADLESLIGTR